MLPLEEKTRWSVRFREGAFTVALPGEALEVVVTTPLDLSMGFEGQDFEVHSFASRDLKESATDIVYLKRTRPGGEEPRIGLMIPSAALGSTEHSLASEQYFRDYAFMGIKLALENLASDSPHRFEMLAAEPGPVNFSELFDENIVFFVLSCAKIPRDSNFSVDRAMPSFLSRGYVPAASCDPATLQWTGSKPMAADTPGTEVVVRERLKLSLISGRVNNLSLVSKLLVLAATSGSSPLIQFFYLYQIFEYLMEDVMRHRLPLVTADMIQNLQSGGTLARDQFKLLGDEMSEGGRLQLLVSKYSNCASELTEFGAASSDLLASVGVNGKKGIDAVYGVRNFLFHQARNLPDNEEENLVRVVRAFSGYLPALLATYETPTSL